MNRILMALGGFAAVAVLSGCGMGQKTSKETAVSHAPARSEMAAYVRCPYPKCATIDASGGESYCRIDEDSNIAVREIAKEAQFETNQDVTITLHPGDGNGGHCSANAKLPKGDTTISIKREPGGGFDMSVGRVTDGVINHVHLEPVTSTVGRVHWLMGSNELQLANFDYVVYLIDEPQGESTIVKHYRLEIFDKDCQSHMPVENVNFGLKTKYGCTAETTRKGNVVAYEATSGDGYEPKK